MQYIDLPADKKIEDYSFNFKSLLGEGSFSKVYLGKNDKNNELVAIKVVDIKTLKDDFALNLLKSEIKILKDLKHPNILCCHEVITTSNNIYIITEFCEGGDLGTLLEQRKCFPEEECINIMKHILKGYREILKKRVIHRDIKPANIFIKGNEYKIGDFGFAKTVNNLDDNMMTSLVGTPLYMSPQCLQRQYYSSKNDIWSLGIFFYEMLFGITPWPCRNHIELIHNMHTMPVNFPLNIQIRDDSRDFLLKALQIHESSRMSWDSIFKHPLFRDIDDGTIFQEEDSKSNVLQKAGSKVNNEQPLTDTTLNTLQMQRQNSKKPPHQRQQQQQPNGYFYIPNGSENGMYVHQQQQQQQHQRKKQFQPEKKLIPPNFFEGKAISYSSNLDQQEEKILEETAKLSAPLMMTSFMVEEFKKNTTIINSQVKMLQFLIFIKKIYEKTSSGIEISPYRIEKLGFLLNKHMMITLTNLSEVLHKKINKFGLSEWENYVNSPDFIQLAKTVDVLGTESVNSFNKIWTEFDSNKHIKGELLIDLKFKKLFNLEFSNSAEFFTTLGDYLTGSIRELNHTSITRIRKNSSNLHKEDENITKFLSCLVFLYAITLINNQYHSDFASFSKKVNFEHIMNEVSNTINLAFVKNLRKSIYDLNV